MRYIEPLFRPPAEADSFILQATLGCSWNACTYCAMYRSKSYCVRPLSDIQADIQSAAPFADEIRHVFVADGDPLGMEMSHWEGILRALNETFPRLRRVSTYATARNILGKSPSELQQLKDWGLKLLYIGPESGDDLTLKNLAKGATAADHVLAADRAREAGLEQSLIFLLGAGGRARSLEHAKASGELAGKMNPRFLSTLTLTVVPGTPIARLQEKGSFELPDKRELLQELHAFIEACDAQNAIFRSDHASNYLPIEGRLPRDKGAILQKIEAALHGQVRLRPEWARGL